MPDKEPKCACGRSAMLHTIWKYNTDTPEYLCCTCYVKAGHPPCDWHPECMATAGRGDETVEWKTA